MNNILYPRRKLECDVCDRPVRINNMILVIVIVVSFTKFNGVSHSREIFALVSDSVLYKGYIQWRSD